jgi:hypothetical protein
MDMTVCVIWVIVVMTVLAVTMAMRMPVTAVGPTFGLKGFMNHQYRHVHGAQHVGQHMVWLNL